MEEWVRVVKRLGGLEDGARRRRSIEGPSLGEGN